MKYEILFFCIVNLSRYPGWPDANYIDKGFYWQVSFFLCRFLFMQFLPFSAAIGLGLQVCRDWDYYCDQGHAPLLHLQVTGCIQYLKKIESHPKF